MTGQLDWEYLLGMLGIIAFACTAVLAVIPKGIDLFGACVLGVVTAIGGGTIRDLILEIPVFWATDIIYIWVAIVASVITFYGNTQLEKKHIYHSMLYLDGLGVAMFVIQGAEKARDMEFALPVGPVILGLITAIGGGILRDMLAGNPTLIMKKELYAVPLTVGVVLYMVLCNLFPEKHVLIGTFCSFIIFVFRGAAIRWNLTVPKWMLLHN